MDVLSEMLEKVPSEFKDIAELSEKHPSMFESVSALARDLFSLHGKDESLVDFCWNIASVVCYREMVMNPS